LAQLQIKSESKEKLAVQQNGVSLHASDFSNTAWAVDFETPVGGSTVFSFFIFLGQHRQK
jgi:hypothetical protein